MALHAPAIAIAAALAAAAASAIVIASRELEAPVSPAPEAAVPAVAEPAEAAPAEPRTGDAASAEPEPAAPMAPSLDVVRVTPEGSAVVAGRAAPGSTVTLRTEDGALAEAEADASGEFVAVFETAPAAEPRTLTVESAGADGTRVVSEDVVVLLPEPPALSFDDPDFAAAAGPTDAEGDGIAAAVGANETGPRPRLAGAAVLRGGDVEVNPAAGATDGLTLASIAYGAAGDVTLAGLGAAGARLVAYVDDRFAREGAVGGDGRWSLELGDVEAGIYRLRIDALGDDGRVEARLETPFQRDVPDADGAALQPGAITVQPGSNLWTIARVHYGSGVLYTRIYTANRDLIRDPALIYPGQIFVLPEGEPGE